MDINSAFVTDLEPTILMQPTLSPFNHPTVFTQPAAVRRVAFGQHGLDSSLPQFASVWLGVVGAVPLCAFEPIQERVAKLSGGVAVIKVGAATEVEMKEKKARVDDALHSTRAAVEEGVITWWWCCIDSCTKSVERP